MNQTEEWEAPPLSFSKSQSAKTMKSHGNRTACMAKVEEGLYEVKTEVEEGRKAEMFVQPQELL